MAHPTIDHEPLTDSPEIAHYYLAISKRLDHVVPSIYWFSNSQICQLLNISETTRRRDAALLRALGLISSKKRQGMPREEAAVLWEFRQLQKWSDRDEAVNLIFDVMEALNAEQG